MPGPCKARDLVIFSRARAVEPLHNALIVDPTVGNVGNAAWIEPVDDSELRIFPRASMWILGVRKLIPATASVLVIGIGGTAMSHAADLGKTAPNPSWNTPASSGPSQHPQAAAALSKDDIREAQLELRHSGLYNGSLDGMIGPQTKQALARFQKDNGLEQTATLDALTMVAMFGNIGASEGSSMPRNAGEGTSQ
jgi:hypothetical protein